VPCGMLLMPPPQKISRKFRFASVANRIAPHGVFVNETSACVSESATPAIFHMPVF
jgi:hypothetical protein